MAGEVAECKKLVIGYCMIELAKQHRVVEVAKCKDFTELVEIAQEMLEH